MSGCPFCQKEIQAADKFCAHCGHKVLPVTRKKYIGVAGIIAIGTVIASFLVPPLLTALLIFIAAVCSVIEFITGKRSVGIVVLCVGMLEFCVMAKTIEYALFGFLDTINSTTPSAVSLSGNSALDWKDNLKVTYSDFDDLFDIRTYSFEVKNVGTHVLKRVSFNLQLLDSNDTVIATKSETVISEWNDPLRPNEIRKFSVMTDKIKSVKLSHKYNYWFRIIEYD